MLGVVFPTLAVISPGETPQITLTSMCFRFTLRKSSTGSVGIYAQHLDDSRVTAGRTVDVSTDPLANAIAVVVLLCTISHSALLATVTGTQLGLN